MESKKKKKTTRKKLCPIHSLETRRGRGRSCWVKADKTFANRAKEQKRKNTLHVWTDFTTAGSSNFDWNDARCWYPLCWPWACCAFNCTLVFTQVYWQRYLVTISQARQRFPSLWSLTSKSPMISTLLSKEPALPGVFVDSRVLEESSLRRATVADVCLHHCAESNFRFVPVAQTQCPFTSRRSTLKNSLSSPIMPCSRALFNVRNRAFRPDVRLPLGSSIDRFIRNFGGSTIANRKGPAATRRKPADRCARCFLLTPNCSHKQLARLSSLSFVRVWKWKPFLIHVFRRECSCGRNDAPGLRVLGAKLRLHQVFWSQNLAFQSQNATMRPDFSSPVPEVR